ncbi:hypothetical protein MT488_14650 [Enterobacter ludwigii]|uniref:hypothetical protein n=1 Tax=Enterobacter ludwigii TaxID=299767 RepID=UPI001FB9E26B|nr:hypothetical protein [Enterobacter ludwigii]UOH49842.1 hypothetical protein MT488_14650 [Enterobacter ludwigii]
MSTITKQWLQQTIAEMEEHRDLFPGDLDDNHENVLSALRIALASIEAEPVAFRSKLKSPAAIGSERWDYTDHRQPDAFELENCVIERLYTAPPAPVAVPDAMTPKQASRAYCGEVRGYRDGWNACRAVMLQGADGNSPVIPDGWVMVPVEPTAEMLQSGISAHYERSQIQIHDRPAPGPMECAYVAMLAAAPQQEVKS